MVGRGRNRETTGRRGVHRRKIPIAIAKRSVVTRCNGGFFHIVQSSDSPFRWVIWSIYKGDPLECHDQRFA